MAVAGALLMALAAFNDVFVLAGSGMFLSVAGGTFTGFLIFYSAAVKGYVQFRETQLGTQVLRSL